MYLLFAVAVCFWLRLYLLDLDAKRPPFHLLRDLGAVTFLLGVFFALALVRRYLWESYFANKRGIVIPKFLHQLVAILAILIALFCTLMVAYEMKVGPLLIGSSGVLTLVIGFAMQDILGNIIAGIAMQVNKPYRQGDWLRVEDQYAEVMEINWRSTRFRNNDGIYLDIPNSTISKNTIINLNYGTRSFAIRLCVGIDYKVPPNIVKKALVHAASHAKGVLPNPPPKAALLDFGESSIRYEIKFWMDDHRYFNDTTDAIRTAVWYELHREGINIPFPIRTIQLERRRKSGDNAQPDDRAQSLICGQSIFSCLDDTQSSALLGKARLMAFGRDEFIIEKGDAGNSMFILVSGTATAHLDEEGKDRPVASFQAGDCFGEMSLLTGEPRAATIIATSDCDVLEISKQQLSAILHENSDLSLKLSNLLAERRMQNEETELNAAGNSARSAKQSALAGSLLNKITRFFEI